MPRKVNRNPGIAKRGDKWKARVFFDGREYSKSFSTQEEALRSGTKQSTRVVADSQVRRLTPLECERLQGFPDGWTEGQSDTHRYKQMGNAVAVPVVDWLIKGITQLSVE